jgi:hypothetical protein
MWIILTVSTSVFCLLKNWQKQTLTLPRKKIISIERLPRALKETKIRKGKQQEYSCPAEWQTHHPDGRDIQQVMEGEDKTISSC